MNTTSANGLYVSIAAIVVEVLGHYNVPIATNDVVSVIASVALVVGVIHGLIAHKNLVSAAAPKV